MRLVAATVLVGALAAGCASKDLLANLPDAAPPDAGMCGPSSLTGPVVYINRFPTVIAPGDDDSLTDTSSVVQGTTSTSGWDVDDADFIAVMGCLSELLSPFGVVVADDEPTTEHVEIVVTNASEELGLPRTGSVAPVSCGANRRSVGFAFLGGQGSDTRRACEAIAFPIGVIAGADYSRRCYDIMNTFNAGCDTVPGGYDPTQPRSFIDADAACGQNEDQPCVCSGDPEQNTFEILTAFFAGYCEAGT